MDGFGLGWRQVACCFVLLGCVAFVAATYGVIAVPLGQAFNPSRMVLMLAMTVMAGVSGVLSPFLGTLMDRASMRKVMITGALLLSAGYAALSLTTSFAQVLLVFGLIIAPANVLIGPVAATVLLSRWFTKKRGMAIGIAISGIAMSAVIFPPIVQGLFSHFLWRTAFQLTGLLLGILTLAAALLVVDKPSDRGLFPDGVSNDIGGSGNAAPYVPVLTIISDPAFWLATGIFTAVIAGTKGMVTNLAPMAIDVGLKPIDAALLVSIYGAAGFAAKLSFAMIADRLNTRGLMFTSLSGFAVGMGCLANAAAGFWMIAAGVGCVGLAGGIMVPMQSYLIPRIFGAHCVGRAYGLMSTVMFVFMLSTPPLFGWVYDITGSYAAIFLIFIGLTLGSMIAVPFLRLRPRHTAPIGASSPSLASEPSAAN